MELKAEARSSTARASGPPGPFGLRNLARFATGQLELLRELADTYGDVVEMKILGGRWFLVSHPDDIEHLIYCKTWLVHYDYRYFGRIGGWFNGGWWWGDYGAFTDVAIEGDN